MGSMHVPEGLPPRWPGGALRGKPTTDFYVACLRSELAHLIYNARQFAASLPGYPSGTGEMQLWMDIRRIEELMRAYGMKVEKPHDKWPTLFKAECWLRNLLSELPPHSDRYPPKGTEHARRFRDAAHIQALEQMRNMLPAIDLIHADQVNPGFIPSIAELEDIANSIRGFLATYEEHRLFLEDLHDITTVSSSLSIRDALTVMEKLLNPHRLPLDSPDRPGLVVRKWPSVVMTGLSALRKIVYELVIRWDIPEICEDKRFIRGNFSMTVPTADGGTAEIEVNRPPRPYTLTSGELERLTWTLNKFDQATYEVFQGEDTPLVETGSSPPSEPSTSNQREAPEHLTIDYEAVAERLLKAGKTRQASLVRYMAGRESAEVQDIAEAVHDDRYAREGTLRENARKTSASLVEMGIPLSFRVASGRMWRETSPE